VYANAIGDRRAHLILAMVYSKAQGNEAATAAYVELASENYRVALQMDDSVLQANAGVYLVDALGHAVQISEALDLAETGLAQFPRNIPPHDWILGFNPISVCSHWRAVCLNWSGRLREGFAEVDRAMRFL
jgi:hypothetical protein